MKKLVLFFVFLFSVSNAQQLESLKFFKKKHDSISTSLKEKFLKESQGKSEVEQSKLHVENSDELLKNNIERIKNYKSAVKEFLEKQDLKSANIPENETSKNTDALSDKNAAVLEMNVQASYSLGFPELYKEVHDFISNQVGPLSNFEYSSSSKIQFVVKQDGSLFIEKVEGIDPNFNDLSLLAFLMTKGKWIPAKQGGRIVKSRLILPIKFVIKE